MPHHSLLRIASALTLATLLAAGAASVSARPAAAQDGGGDAQVLWGGGFRDASVGNATVDGALTTLTLEHFGGWALGDHFFFVDMTTGTFDADVGRGYGMYSEWTPRLSLSKATGASFAAGPVTDLLLVGEVHASSGGYAAGLIGPGADLAVPGFHYLTVGLLRRDDNFSPATWQATAAWSLGLPFGVAGQLAGFIDVIGSPEGEPTVMTQPQLLLEVGPLFGRTRRDLQVGVEWYLHSDGASWHSVPQALVRWAW